MNVTSPWRRPRNYARVHKFISKLYCEINTHNFIMHDIIQYILHPLNSCILWGLIPSLPDRNPTLRVYPWGPRRLMAQPENGWFLCEWKNKIRDDFFCAIPLSLNYCVRVLANRKGIMGMYGALFNKLNNTFFLCTNHGMSNNTPCRRSKVQTRETIY